jgi:hypothetical protein
MSNEATMEQFIDNAAAAWRTHNPPQHIKPNVVPDTFGSRIKMLTTHVSSFDDLVDNPAGLVPWIAVENMPCGTYPAYVAFFLRASYAWLRVTRPDLHRLMSNGSACSTIVPTIGVRAGVTSDLGLAPPAAMSPIGNYLYYDAKRSSLWVRQVTSDPLFSLWVDALNATATVPAATVEAMLAWVSIAPLVACMGAGREYALGSSYTVPFVQRSISSYLNRQLRPEAYRHMCLASPLTWDSALCASIQGQPSAVCRAWAMDPLLALCAERRVQSDEHLIAASKAQEREIARKFQRSASAVSSPASPESADVVWSRVRAAADHILGRARDEDTMSIATALLENAEDGILGPGDSVTAAHTAVPSRAPSPRPQMTAAHINAIRAGALGAQQMPNAAASLLNGVRGDESVHW